MRPFDRLKLIKATMHFNEVWDRRCAVKCARFGSPNDLAQSDLMLDWIRNDPEIALLITLIRPPEYA